MFSASKYLNESDHFVMSVPSVTVTVNVKADGVCRQRKLVQLLIKRDLHLDQTYQAETLHRLDPE